MRYADIHKSHPPLWLDVTSSISLSNDIYQQPSEEPTSLNFGKVGCPLPKYKVKGKMIKYKLMSEQPELRPHLPETHWLSRKRLARMMHSYSSLFIKPDGGSGGSGIIKASKIHKGYKVRYGTKRSYVKPRYLYKAIKYFRNPKKKYIVQKGLSLGRYKGRIFDVRMYLQQPDKEWVVSGMAARVANGKHFVTNYHQGGHPKPLDKVLKHLFADSEKIEDCKKTLIKTSMIIAKSIKKKFPAIRELGIDFGIESDGHVWIIEANSRPAHMLFTKLPDKSMLHRIRRNKYLIHLQK